MLRRARMLAATVAGLALVAAGCGGGGTLDADKVESEIKAQQKKEAGLSPSEFKSLTCPDDIEKKKGDTFNCKAVMADNSQGTVKVTQTSDDGDISSEFNLPSNLKSAEEAEEAQ